ncbi:galactosylgalactosylxylosylprotein 3-beta-glucuronosyltransferase P-like isoform X2 [Penaeus japonicus]|uniref:galactosylgalactosylxylosylprotein 3-beta-glucuronosyltransferase P-like isoform X2 n=1 Tax=Penaeus japonicus TaxID=27405 RepID=UPI001C71115F|nr:galactosylgalactosylxylosylprotein 3-beta-glucuronosyltransferase P-like isoform X2 [Penaeus japonicus]
MAGSKETQEIRRGKCACSTSRKRLVSKYLSVVFLVLAVVMLAYELSTVRIDRISCPPPYDRGVPRQELRMPSGQANRAERPAESVDLPTIYVITPTYRRPVQIPELTRLGQTLMHVPRLHWIVAEDTNNTNRQVLELLDHLGMPYTYLTTPMPSKYRKKAGSKPKGVANRNGGLDWVRQHATSGVIYFADDDNTYDIRVFEEMRYTKRVSMFPVGLVTNKGLSTPVVRNGKFVSFYDGWISKRIFPVDMAGFAINVDFLLKRPDARMPFVPGYEEDGMLRSLNITMDEVEFVAKNCTKVYAWHTRTGPSHGAARTILDAKYNNTNLQTIRENVYLNKK